MMRPLRLALAVLLAPALGLACRDATGPDGDVQVYAIPGNLAIRNDGGTALYSTAFDEQLLPLLDWIPMICDECGKVDPGTTRYVDDDSIMGSGPGRVVVVFYWRASTAPADVAVPGPVTARRVRLHSGLID